LRSLIRSTNFAEIHNDIETDKGISKDTNNTPSQTHSHEKIAHTSENPAHMHARKQVHRPDTDRGKDGPVKVMIMPKIKPIVLWQYLTPPAHMLLVCKAFICKLL
jgi:hypothetical protein